MFRIKKNEILVLLISGIAFLAFALFIQCIVGYKNVSTEFFLFPMIIIAFLIALQGIGNNFNMVIGMGGTRKSYITSIFFLSFIKYGVIFLLAFLISKLNDKMSGDELFLLDAFFEPEIMAVIIFFLVAMETLFGTLVFKYGTKAYWAIWILAMLSNVLGNRIGEAVNSSKVSVLKSIANSMGEFIMKAESYQLAGIGIAFSAVIMAVSAVLLLRQDVTA